jgi:hypothetical protein
MKRIARCCCGSLRVEATGEPLIGLCHCTECQRRTGSAFAVVALFPKEQVRTEGLSKVYARERLRAKSRISFLPRLRHLRVLVRGVPPGSRRRRFWRVRRPVDALAGGIGLGGNAASMGDL